MLDSYNRDINYLRVSVTDRCNLRCRYCMPEKGIVQLPHDRILSFEEITAVVRTGVAHGITKVRITGGEPLVRKGIEKLVGMLAGIKGIEDLSMTTNGVLLKQYASKLFDKGLHRINISLDTLNPEKFRYITRVGHLTDVLNGIEAARSAGLSPLKINCVIRQDVNEQDAMEVAAYAAEQGLEVRFIKLMDLHSGRFSTVINGNGGDCIHCNRLRLTADGFIKPCLFNDIQFSIRELGIEKAYQEAVRNKPKCGTINHINEFFNIGG